MNPRRIERPTTLPEALSLLKSKNARPMAGGTDMMIERRHFPFDANETWVALGRLRDLRNISHKAGCWHIGPLVTHAELANHIELQRVAAFLPQAASMVGSPQIRAQGTVGGNIANAASCADTVPPLIALGAEITLESAEQKRKLPLADFFVAPYKTVRRRDELVTDISFPDLLQSPRTRGPTTRTAFLKLGRRQALAISRLSVAVLVVGNEALDDVRISVGSVLPRFGRLHDAEEMLKGKPAQRDLFREAGRAGSAEAVRIAGRRWSTDYKEPVLAALIHRALCIACDVSWQ
jgi:CO/xanthine dehydrogenase FAD-binding subunit